MQTDHFLQPKTVRAIGCVAEQPVHIEAELHIGNRADHVMEFASGLTHLRRVDMVRELDALAAAAGVDFSERVGL